MKLVRYPISVAQICFAIISMLCTSQAQPAVATGEYLRTDYISLLKSTRSPRKSTISGSAQLLLVNRDTNGISIQAIFNFHEGGLTFLLKPDGKIVLTEEQVTNPFVGIIDSAHIKLGYNTSPAQIYCFVGNAEHFAEGICLVGQYLDKDKKKYIFMNDGTVLLRQNKLNYQIGLDVFPALDYDYFTTQSPTDTTQYAFSRQNDTIMLFDVVGGDLWQDGKIDLKSGRYLKKQ
jgi:hypothetical protein